MTAAKIWQCEFENKRSGPVIVYEYGREMLIIPPGKKALLRMWDAYQPSYARFSTVVYGPGPDEVHVTVNRHWVSLASFGKTEESEIEPEEQRLLLIIYFYALFFESIFTEKPVATFVGKLQSGKTFLATTIGKIIFGDGFVQTAFPTDDDFLRAVLHQNRLVVLDDLKKIPNEMRGTLDSYSTGRPEWGRRKMRELALVRTVPRVFFSITANEMFGWSPEFMRRVLLFNTAGLATVKPPDEFWEPIRRDRDLIMTEVLVNLRSIVALLKYWKTARFTNPSNITAAFSLFGQKVTSVMDSKWLFRRTLAKMVAKKGKTLLEDDPFWRVLRYHLFEKPHWAEGKTEPVHGEEIVPRLPHELFTLLSETAEEMKLKEFFWRYKNADTIGLAINKFRTDLEKEIKVIEIKGSSRQRLVGFGWKPEEQQAASAEEQLPEEKQAFLDWENKYKDDRLPEGVNEVEESRQIEPGSDEWAEAVVKNEMDKVTDEDVEDVLKRLERLGKEK